MKKISTALLGAALILASVPALAYHHHGVISELSGFGHYLSRHYKQDQLGKGNPGVYFHQNPDGSYDESAVSPDGACQKIIVGLIDHAQSQVLVQAYGFTNKAIIKALVEAHRRGVDVRIILDKSNETAKYSGATTVSNAGIPTYIDDKVAIAHNKVMIFDRKTVLTGSYNFTSSAQKRNAENIYVRGNLPPMAKFYIRNWNWRLGVSHKYERR